LDHASLSVTIAIEHENINEVKYSIAKNSVEVLWDAWDMNNFYFLFLLFSDFIRILFSFSFLLDNEEVRDIAVT